MGDSLAVNPPAFAIQPLPVMPNYVVAGGGDQAKTKPEKKVRKTVTWSLILSEYIE